MVVGFDNETMTKWINEVVKPGYQKKTNAETAECYPLVFNAEKVLSIQTHRITFVGTVIVGI